MNNFRYTRIVNILSWCCITVIRNKRVLYIPGCINLYTLRMARIVQSMYGKILILLGLYFILYCILTRSMEQIPYWETNWFPSSQEISPFYGTQSFIAAFTSACHLSVSSAHTSESIQVWDTSLYFITWCFYGEEYLTKPLSWGTTPCRQSATAYSIYSQLPSILEAVPPSANWGHAMPWWQGPTYLGYIAYRDWFIIRNDS